MRQGYHEIDTKEFSSAILNKWWLIVLTVILASGLAFFITEKYIAPTYKADVTLFIGKEENDIGGIEGISFTDLDTNNQLITDYTKIAGTRLVIEEVIKNLNTNMSINEFIKGMSVYIIGSSRLFGVSYTSVDPEFSAAAANELAKQLSIAAADIVGVKNIKVIDNALVPDKPAGPNTVLNTLIGSVLGLFFSMFSVFINFILNNKVEREEDVTKLIGVPVIGMIPRFKVKSTKLVSRNSESDNKSMSNIIENYKMLRANINYRNLKAKNQVLMFTSSRAGEGKTTTISNLAVAMVQEGKEVLLIDCDLRRPKVHELFEVDQTPGLSSILFEENGILMNVKSVQCAEGLNILTSGALPPSTDEIFGSEEFTKMIEEAREKYDFVLIDTPPITSVTDAITISQNVDGVIFVVAAHETKKSVIRQANNALNKVGANIVGVAVTKFKVKKSVDYYSYYYSEKPGKPKKWFGKRS